MNYILRQVKTYGSWKKDWPMAFAVGIQTLSFALNLWERDWFAVINICFIGLLSMQYLLMLMGRADQKMINDLFDILHDQQRAYDSVIDTMTDEIRKFKAGFAAKGTNGKSAKTKTKR